MVHDDIDELFNLLSENEEVVMPLSISDGWDESYKTLRIFLLSNEGYCRCSDDRTTG